MLKLYKNYKSISFSRPLIKHIFCVNICYILNTTQSLALTATLLVINKQQISSL